MPTTDRIDVARELAAHGHFRPAVDVLRTAIAQDPHQDALRIALAELYRDGGYPDQAGRWGFVVAGWATDHELRLFARSFHPEAEVERIAAAAHTTVERVPSELIELVRASRRPRAEPSAEVSRGMVAGSLAVLALVVGSVIVFVATQGKVTPAAWALTVAASLCFLGTLASAVWLLSALSKRLWLSAVLSLAVGLVLFLLACWLVAVQIVGMRLSAHP